MITEAEKYLFNLSEDISEKNNLANIHPDKVHELETALTKWEQEVSDNVNFRIL